MTGVKIAPSMMCADFIRLGDELDLMKARGIDYLHIDVMDGHYVPNFTLGPDFCRKLARYSPIPLDIHLMIENLDAYVPLFAGFPNAVVSVHPEVSYHPVRTLQLIASLGARAGVAIEPGVPVSAVECLLPHASFVCVMTVSPGYAGQKLIPETLPKITQVAEIVARNNYPIEIEVDGNVSWQNIPRMIDAGAQVLVAGTSSLYDPAARLDDNIHRLYRLVGREE